MSVAVFIQTSGRKPVVSRIVGRRDRRFHAIARWPGGGADNAAIRPFGRARNRGGGVHETMELRGHAASPHPTSAAVSVDGQRCTTNPNRTHSNRKRTRRHKPLLRALGILPKCRGSRPTPKHFLPALVAAQTITRRPPRCKTQNMKAGTSKRKLKPKAKGCAQETK